MVAPDDRPSRHDDRLLLAIRTILLLGPLDHETATRTAAQLMSLDADGPDEITVHVACEDGDLLGALMLAETIDLAASPVTAIAKGVVGGVALAPFAAAQRRLASPRATFRLSETRHAVSGVASEVTTQAEELSQQVAQLRAWVTRATGRPEASVAADFERRLVMDAEAAQAYGLVHELATRPDGGTAGS